LTMIAVSPQPKAPPNHASDLRATKVLPCPDPTPVDYNMICGIRSLALCLMLWANRTTFVGCSASGKFRVPSIKIAMRFMNSPTYLWKRMNTGCPCVK
jgi:hypothetical protein